jgi:hypothetical protein
MARRIPTGITDTAQLGILVDRELARLETMAKQGFVSNSKPVATTQSYFYVDDGTLKFFNATTNETTPVQLGS